MDNSSLHHEEVAPSPTNTLKEWFLRIWKYKLHYMIVLPALLLLVIFKLIPFIDALIMPFIDYKVFAGISNSPWVGLDNFRQLFDAPEFKRILANTLLIKTGYILASGITALILALALSSIRSGRLRNTLTTLVLIPYFIPAVVFAYAVMLILSPSSSPFFNFDIFILTEPDLFRPVLIAVEVIKTCGIPVLIALAAIAANHSALTRDESSLATEQDNFIQMNLMPAIRGISAFMLLQLSTLLSTDMELISSLINPLVYQTGDTLNTYIYRIGFINAQFSIASALWLIQFFVQLLFTLFAYFLVRGFFRKDLFSPSSKDLAVKGNLGGSFVGVGITIVYLLIAMLPIYLLFIHPFFVTSTSDVGIWDLLSESNFVRYLGFSFAAVIIHLLITLTLAYPLTVSNLPGRGIYKIFLLFILVMGAGSIHEYFSYREMDMVNTIFPQVFTGLFSIISIFVLKGIFNSKYADLKEQAEQNGRGELHAFFTLFIPKIWKPLIALGVLQWVFIWNSYYTALLYTNDPSIFSPVLLFRSLSMGAHAAEGIAPGDPMIMQFGAMISLPSILLLLIFRRWLTSEVFVGQIRNM